jgi:hypothetical protein
MMDNILRGGSTRSVRLASSRMLGAESQCYVVNININVGIDYLSLPVSPPHWPSYLRTPDPFSTRCHSGLLEHMFLLGSRG